MFPADYEYMVYCEPFIGAGHVYYAKRPSVREVISDADEKIYILHDGLKRYSSELTIRTFDIDREQYNVMRSEPIPTDPQARFVRQWILQAYGRTGQGRSYSTDYENGTRNRAKVIPYVSHRLEHTDVRCSDWLDIVKEFDNPNTLFYFDPPYECSKRTAEYTHAEFHLEDMIPILQNMQGKFVLTYNDSEQNRNLLSMFDVRVVSVRYPLSKTVKNELLVKNYWSE